MTVHAGEPTLCLNMIVRNEAAVIARCLRSVRDIIDYWVIVDTGSADETPAIVQATLAGVPGELHRHDWVDFGHNRNQALDLARGKADYLLFMDADMVANVHEPFKAALRADSYLIRYEGALDYCQPMLVADRHPWRYEGVTHEYLTCDETVGREKLPALTLTHFADGGMRGDKPGRDIALLQKALAAEPGNVRHMFYLAQSYADAGDPGQAATWYERRIQAGGWQEEVWYARYRLGQVRRELGRPWPEVLATLLQAYEARPGRAEPLYPIVKHYREQGRYHSAHLFAKTAMAIPYPTDDLLFIERDVYRFLLPFEYAICCHYTGNHAEAIRINTRLADEAPEPWRTQAIENRQFSLAALDPAHTPD